MKKIIELFVSDKVVLNMKSLYPAWEFKEHLLSYYKEKFKLCFTVLFVGLFLAFISFATSDDSIENGRIKRNSIGKADKKLTLYIEESDENTKDTKEFDVTVSGKRYSDKEIRKLADEFNDVLIKTILNKNKSADYIDSDLSFVKKIDGYPFDISYSVEKPLLISRDGKINFDKVIDESEVKITVTYTYFDFSEECEFYVCLYKPLLTRDEELSIAINEALLESDLSTIDEDYYYLPESVLGKKIKFYEKKRNNTFIIVALTLVSCVMIFFMKDNDIGKEVKKREEELMLEYPRLINKFTLFYNCGMPIKKIWFKICSDYENEACEKNPLYEEMIITRNSIADGKSEIEAYEDFARRINLRSYQVFSNLLIQAIVMGKKEFSNSLMIECNDAFSERKNKAKRMFEEAGTKLLVPMFMMLFVVVIIIMFPAFGSFSF